MKLFKKITAAAASVVIAGSMAISASAATWQEAVQAAKDAGCQDHNVQQLSTFLEANSTYFTAAQYDKMIAKLKEISDKFVKPAANDMGVTDLSTLTEAQKVEIGKKVWSDENRQEIIDALVNLGKEFNVTVTVTKAASNANYAGYDVSATINGAENPVNPPIEQTGTESEPVNTAAVVGASAAILLAGAGIVVVAKKNKEN